MMVNDGYIGISSGKLLQFAIENGIEIVELPSYKMAIPSIVFCERLPEGIQTTEY